MSEEKNELQAILIKRQKEKAKGSNNYKKFDLSFNPFPKSGTASVNTPDSINQILAPFDESVQTAVENYILDTLYTETRDKYLSATVTGNYGSGKTQLLLYFKYLLGLASTVKDPDSYRNPFVIYIDNPGARLTELIGAIILRIGEEDFKKFIWNKIIAELEKNDDYRQQLTAFMPKQGSSLFSNINADPFALENTVNYKKFIDSFLYYLNPKKKKEFLAALKETNFKILNDWKQDSVVARYFNDLIAEDPSSTKTWEILSKGEDKSLDKKEVILLKTIVELVEKQGYTDFYILVDEFEDLTEGRLTKTELDNYLRNLRTLIDQDRNWCPVFTMTDVALKKIHAVSPPLADRLNNRPIRLAGFDDSQARYITVTYLNLARTSGSQHSDTIHPFSEDGLQALRKLTSSNLRTYLKTSFELIERGVEKLKEDELINSSFVKANYKEEPTK